MFLSIFLPKFWDGVNARQLRKPSVWMWILVVTVDASLVGESIFTLHFQIFWGMLVENLGGRDR